MKIVCFLVCSFSFVLLSCNKEARSCETLNAALLAMDVPGVKGELDPWLAELLPTITQEDPTGHQQNLQSFRNRLENECSMEAGIVCYACIETYPVQSEISIALDSAGHQVHRVLDIVTPENNVMSIRDIHL